MCENLPCAASSRSASENSAGVTPLLASVETCLLVSLPFRSSLGISCGALCGMGLISLGFTITKNCNFTNYPAEAFCALVAERVRMRYGTCKIFLDFAYVIFALLICWRAGLGLGVVREGTVIFALLDGVLINLMTPAVRGCFDRLDHILKT